MSDQSEWVSLGEAADLLGVHPTTVRSWADSGDLPSQRTPGGHRRFRRADLAQWAHRQSEGSPGEVQLMIQSTLGRARMELLDSPEMLAWRGDLDPETRQLHATLGRRILELLYRLLTHPEAEDAIMLEVHEVGSQYGHLAQRHQLSLQEATRAYLFFRDMLTDSVIQMAEALSLRTASDWGGRMRQVNRITGELLLALLDAYHTQP